MNLLVGCAAAPVAVDGPRVFVDAAKVSADGAVVLHAPAGSTVEASGGLVATARDEGTWELRGAAGSYVVTVTPPSAAPERVFVDVGVDGPSAGELAELVPLAPQAPSPWPYVAGGVLLAALLAGLAYAAYRRLRRPPPPPVPEPPHVVAMRAWEALRARRDLSPEEVARQGSEIFRTWLSAAYQFPATRRTTREIVDNLAGSLTALELDATRRLLTATDLVKFAERGDQADVLARLDDDFRGLVRPVRRSASA